MSKADRMYVKHHLDVGLSADLPMEYADPEQKYTIADWVTNNVNHAVTPYEKDHWTYEFVQTELVEYLAKPRFRCHLLVSLMPQAGLEEAEEELHDILVHHLEVARHTRRVSKQLVDEPRVVDALVLDRIRT